MSKKTKFGFSNEMLPHSRDIDKNKLLQVFHRTTNSYKYLFFMAILEILEENNFENLSISFRAITIHMLTIAWYPYKYFRLSFGLSDKIGTKLDQIDLEFASSSIFTNPLSFFSIKKELLKALSKTNVNLKDLMRYVPFRFISPFFEDLIRGEADAKKNLMIEGLSKEKFHEFRPFYKIHIDSEEIVLHQAWKDYFHENYGLVWAFIKWEWLGYMQRNNSSVPNLQSKLFPDQSKNSMKNQIDFWKQVVCFERFVCIYSKQIINEKNFSLDHFIPWTFVAHNQLWNLIPTPKPVNSSKSNNLPSLSKYFEEYVSMQHRGLSIYRKIVEPQTWRKVIEPYQLDLGMTPDKILNINLLRENIKKTIYPLAAIASNMGFSENWEYKD